MKELKLSKNQIEMSRERKRVSECESGDVMRKRKQKWGREREEVQES